MVNSPSIILKRERVENLMIFATIVITLIARGFLDASRIIMRAFLIVSGFGSFVFREVLVSSFGEAREGRDSAVKRKCEQQCH